jgi:two-component system sensor histidine kinase MprB
VTFRRRLVLACALAVAVAVALASSITYVVVGNRLRSQIDQALTARVADVGIHLGPTGAVQITLPPDPLGGASAYAQAVNGRGVAVAPGNAPPALPVTPRTVRVALGVEPNYFSDEVVAGIHVRVLTVNIAEGLAVEIARPLDEVDATLGRLRLILLLVSLGGLVSAAVLGWAVTRASLRPVRRLTEAAEHVTATGDLTERIDVEGDDEIARLGASFNAMMAALEESLRTQRQLVADASHELRTPLTTLRTNVEVLARADRLPESDRQALLSDVVAELDELTRLVADLVELARGAEPPAAPEDIHLDDLVRQVAGSALRHAPSIRFDLDLQPCVVRGVPSRLERAVGNLLENAAKWSPRGDVVDVTLRDGELAVRDHGPGVEDEDLPYVFDRFYRAVSARGLPGSGLGLAIVRQVAESHGGSVSVSRAEGGGARFVLRLPVLAGGPEPALGIAPELPAPPVDRPGDVPAHPVDVR